MTPLLAAARAIQGWIIPALLLLGSEHGLLARCGLLPFGSPLLSDWFPQALNNAGGAEGHQTELREDNNSVCVTVEVSVKSGRSAVLSRGFLGNFSPNLCVALDCVFWNKAKGSTASSTAPPGSGHWCRPSLFAPPAGSWFIHHPNTPVPAGRPTGAPCGAGVCVCVCQLCIYQPLRRLLKETMDCDCCQSEAWAAF